MMNGKLLKNEDYGWFVSYKTKDGMFEVLQLHPDNVNEILEDSKVFDNIEARILANPQVEFDIVENNKMSGVAKYAKLISKTN